MSDSVVELIDQKRIMKIMRRIKSILALLLLLLLPIQGFAVVTNSLCHQISSSSHEVQVSHEDAHLCHQVVKHHSHSDHQKEKNQCVSACGQLNMAALTVALSPEPVRFTPSYGIDSSKTYHSVLLPKFQRPPIQIS